MQQRADSDGHRTPELRIGTSGWSYDHWSGIFYPKGLGADKRLEHYVSHFDTVEVNATFYRLQSEKTVARWRDTVPEGFVFAVKGSRYITHIRRLADAAEPLSTFFERMRPLGDKLGVVLWQLPPNLHRDDELLDGFLGELPGEGPRHAVEFRHDSWLAEKVFAILREYGAAMVNVSGDTLREDLTPIADFVYARFHGTTRYHGAYERPALEPWAEFLRAQLDAGRDCFAYFNNDAEGHAPTDAKRLLEMLDDMRR